VPIDPAPRRGRRDNGLDAAAYVPLGDVDPRVGEHLLDVLRVAGVPAYLEPSADVEPYTRTLALPSPPADRLWVDRERRAEAGEIVAAEGGGGFAPGADPPGDAAAGRARGDDRPSAGLDDADEELVWERIVAAFEAPADPAVPPWPVEEDAEPAPRRDDDAVRDRPFGDVRRGLRRVEREEEAAAERADPDPPVAPAGDAADGEGDDEEHYVPPPPPPIPRLSRQAVLGIALVALGALLFVAPGTVGADEQTGLTFGILAVLAGAGLLILRLRDSRSDDGPDDGAVV